MDLSHTGDGKYLTAWASIMLLPVFRKLGFSFNQEIHNALSHELFGYSSISYRLTLPQDHCEKR